jgi:chemosensory pili system protein ChpC
MAEGNRELKCLVLPVGGLPLIVPNVAVAEIVTQQDVAPQPDAPAWLLGTGAWRGMQIPLIAFDYLSGERDATPDATGRYVVMYGLEGEGAPPFYGVRIDALPRTETVDAERLRPAEGGVHDSDMVATRAIVGERECLVPAFERLGHELTRRSPRPATS